jgi:hypothetical protein
MSGKKGRTEYATGAALKSFPSKVSPHSSRPSRDRDRGPGPDGSLGGDRVRDLDLVYGPNDDRVRCARGRRPNNPQKIALDHDVAVPSTLLHVVKLAEGKPREAAAVRQLRYQPKPALGLLIRRSKSLRGLM